ncbi:hypothetical protein [Epibacterium ulvae]|uniref:hypothetical protein n=1 Tax=Epibacterium ulvae TaxID=1156985 RepID=UPI002492DDEE|nr:hypothetical protein [Epibacterium ulvae]
MVTEHSYLVKVTQAGVAMPPVPAGVARSLRVVSVTNADTTTNHILTVEVERGGAVFEVVSAFPVIAEQGAQSAAIGPSVLEAGDILRFLASQDDHLTVWVSYHDRKVAA